MTAARVVGTLDGVVEDAVTHPLVRDVALPSGRTLALITLHNLSGRPATFGPAGLARTAGHRPAARRPSRRR